MKVFALHNGAGSRYYRLNPMLKQMQEYGHEVISEPHNTEDIAGKIEWADIVIFQMVFSVEWVKLAKSLGKKVIFECDDLIHSVPEGHYSKKELSGWGSVKWLWLTYRILRHCDLFISTVPKLKWIYGWIAKDSFVYPNYLDLEHWLKEYHKNTTGRLRILWAGSTSHQPDLLWVKPIMKRVLERHPEVQFIYAGSGGIKSTDKQAQFVYGEDIFEGLPDNREAILSVPGKMWPYVLSSLMADIGIVPLRKNFFNSFKSQCKYLEYAINKIPGVYAAWHYTDVKHGVTGYRAETPEQFEAYIELLIEDKKKREEMGEAAYQDALNNYPAHKYNEVWISKVLSL